MKAIEDMNREELLNTVLFEDDMTLYESFEEQRLLNGDYTEEELRSIIKGWIMECPDTMAY